ncbi:MAG: radical SAM protein [Bacteroidales bacterium]|nr:radical SAM protein [Bacteroidales bacterium]
MNCTKRQRDYKKAYALKLQHRGPQVFFRGLIEISNRCRKNCLYCGIRAGNCAVERYEMSDGQVLQEAQFALDAGYGSIAIQGGERLDSAFIERITRLIYLIRRLQPGGGGRPVFLGSGEATIGAPFVTLPADSNVNNLGITLSLGEQEREVYREWMKAGASRYLLRIEASNKELYEKLHPGFRYTGGAAEESEAGAEKGVGATENVKEKTVGKKNRDAETHSYERRVQALLDLKSEGYLLGSGIMIGLPFQTYAHLEEDLQFLKNLEVDMVGMGPYISHKDTPLGQIVEYWKGGAQVATELAELAALPRGDFWNFTPEQLLELSIDMVARLRILMPHINIAATTALQVLNPDGREIALLAGANVIMPNMTETAYRGNYSLYEGKQGVADDAASTRSKLLENLNKLGIPVGWNLKGDWR